MDAAEAFARKPSTPTSLSSEDRLNYGAIAGQLRLIVLTL